MIILDTNVVSEPLRSMGDPHVRDWLDRQLGETLYLTSINLAELLLGVEMLPSGRRREDLGVALEKTVATLFGPRVLPFDSSAARAYAGLMARARAQGRAIGVADGQIAAIAQVHGFTVASRDTAPFLAAGLSVLNPWEPS